MKSLHIQLREARILQIYAKQNHTLKLNPLDTISFIWLCMSDKIMHIMQFLNKWLFKSTLFKQSIKCALSFNLWNSKMKWHFFSVLQNNIMVASVECTVWLSETFWSWDKICVFLNRCIVLLLLLCCLRRKRSWHHLFWKQVPKCV